MVTIYSYLAMNIIKCYQSTVRHVVRSGKDNVVLSTTVELKEWIEKTVNCA